MNQQHKQHGKKSEESQVQETPQGANVDEELAADTDDLLAEIDDVLETNAEEFVKAYVQKGGE